MKKGKLTVITGCMFSGKTETLISYMVRESYRQRKTICFKPAKDQRYSIDKINSHNGKTIDCHIIEKASQIEEYLSVNPDSNMSIGIEEVQFFDPAIASLASMLSKDGYYVFAAGLDLDSFGHPFGPVPELLAYADRVIKLHAQCVICGENAKMTYRKQTVNNQDTVLVGGHESYEPRCYNCWKS
jgi:thymidine kinase